MKFRQMILSADRHLSRDQHDFISKALQNDRVFILPPGFKIEIFEPANETSIEALARMVS